MNKKFFPILLLIIILLCSCSTAVSYVDEYSSIERMGKLGETLITIDNSKLKFADSRIGRITITTDGFSFLANIMGKFSRIAAKAVSSRYGLNYYCPKAGNLYVSNEDTFEKNNEASGVISRETAIQMTESDFAMFIQNSEFLAQLGLEYSESFEKNIINILVLGKDEKMSIVFTLKDSKTAESLFTIAKATAVNDLKIKGIKPDYNVLKQNIEKSDNKVYLYNVDCPSSMLGNILESFI